MAQSSRRVAVRIAQGSRSTAQWSHATVLRAAPHAQRFGSLACEGWRKYVGVSADEPDIDDEPVIDVDVDDLVLLEQQPLPQIPPPPPMPAFSRYSSDDLAPESSGEFERISEICSPAVVRLARTSGYEARANFGPSSERTSEVGQRRRTAS